MAVVSAPLDQAEDPQAVAAQAPEVMAARCKDLEEEAAEPAAEDPAAKALSSLGPPAEPLLGLVPQTFRNSNLVVAAIGSTCSRQVELLLMANCLFSLR